MWQSLSGGLNMSGGRMNPIRVCAAIFPSSKFVFYGIGKTTTQQLSEIAVLKNLRICRLTLSSKPSKEFRVTLSVQLMQRQSLMPTRKDGLTIGKESSTWALGENESFLVRNTESECKSMDRFSPKSFEPETMLRANTSVKRDRLPACRLQTAPYLQRWAS